MACQPVANKQVPCTVQNQHAPSHPAQRSAASNDRAVVKELRTHTCGQTQAEWLVSKGRQQQDAAAAAEEFIRKEQVSVCRLQAKQQTALGAHQQVQDLRACVQLPQHMWHSKSPLAAQSALVTGNPAPSSKLDQHQARCMYGTLLNILPPRVCPRKHLTTFSLLVTHRPCVTSRRWHSLLVVCRSCSTQMTSGRSIWE